MSQSPKKKTWADFTDEELISMVNNTSNFDLNQKIHKVMAQRKGILSKCTNGQLIDLLRGSFFSGLNQRIYKEMKKRGITLADEYRGNYDRDAYDNHNRESIHGEKWRKR